MIEISFEYQVYNCIFTIISDREMYYVEIDYCEYTKDYFITIFDVERNILSCRKPLVPNYNIVRFDNLKISLLFLFGIDNEIDLSDMDTKIVSKYKLIYEDKNSNLLGAFDYAKLE